MTLSMVMQSQLRKRYDPDAISYISAVEFADGQNLEQPIKDAIINFVVGCKIDGTWPLIKSSCIMMGARTINGALVPLVGPSPTPYNFVSGDYNRKTGLRATSNNSTNNKYVDTNYNATNISQDNISVGVGVSEITSSNGAYIDAGRNTGGSTNISNGGGLLTRCRTSGAKVAGHGSIAVTGFLGLSRNSSDFYTFRYNKGNTIVAQTSETPGSYNFYLYRFSIPVYDYNNGRMYFYYVGNALNMDRLEYRLSTLYNTINNLTL